MSGAMAAAAVVAAATVYSTIEQKKAAEKSAEAQNRAIAESKAASDKQMSLAEQDMNRKNAKTPDAQAILSEASQNAKGGASGTMLTGPQGIDPNALALSKNTLLGG